MEMILKDTAIKNMKKKLSLCMFLSASGLFKIFGIEQKPFLFSKLDSQIVSHPGFVSPWLIITDRYYKPSMFGKK